MIIRSSFRYRHRFWPPKKNRMSRPQKNARVHPNKKKISMLNNRMQNLDTRKRSRYLSIPKRRLRPPQYHKKRHPDTYYSIFTIIQKRASDPRPPPPPNTRQRYEQKSGQNMTQNALKQGKLDSFADIFLFIFCLVCGGWGFKMILQPEPFWGLDRCWPTWSISRALKST